MPSTDFLPFATASGANVEPQSSYAGAAYQTTGFTTGIAKSSPANKAWRQGTMMAAAVANAIVQVLGANVPDDGNLAALVAQFLLMITTLAQNQSKPQVIVVPFSTTPVFDCFAGNPARPVFQISLTANVTSSAIINATPGQLITFHIIENAAGGMNFIPPSSVPMAPINGDPNQVNTQSFAVLADHSIVCASPMHLKL
jgi:hypothetical protein